MAEFGKFFLPGPTEVRPEILSSMTRPMIGHRGPDMVALMTGLDPGLRRLFRTERPVYVSTSSATGLMEAAIRNCVPRRVLCQVCGAFSERFFKIARACGREADRLEVEWGAANEPGPLSEALTDGYDAVTVVHSETSTGVLNPVQEIAETVRRVAPETLLLVDCVSSLAATPVETDAWGLDFALAGTQKALALPPGLALGVASERARERAGRGAGDAGLYFSFEAFEDAAAKHQTTNTPAVSLLYALEAQLEAIEAEGLDARWSRHGAMAERTCAWVDEMRERHGVEMSVLAPAGRRSPSVTCVRVGDGLDGVEIARRAAELGWTIAPGYGRLKASSFRVGHMGDHSVAELEELLAVLETVILGRD